MRTKKKRVTLKRKLEMMRYAALWKKNNRARHLMHAQKYRRKLMADPVKYEKKKKQIKRWKKQNHEKYLEQRRRHYAKHRVRILAYEKAWKELNGR